MTPKAHKESGQKPAAIAALISLPIAYLTQVFFGIASGGDVAVFFDGARALALSSQQADAFIAGMWFDIFGYYLIFVPVIIYVWGAIRHTDPFLVDITSMSGLIYCLLGAFGASTMAGAFGGLYTSAGVTDAAAISAWEATISGQWRGLWLLEAVLAALWLGGLAKLLMRGGRRGLGGFAGLLALIWGVQFAGWHIGAHGVSDIALIATTLLSPLWAAWLGISLWRNPLGAIH